MLSWTETLHNNSIITITVAIIIYVVRMESYECDPSTFPVEKETDHTFFENVKSTKLILQSQSHYPNSSLLKANTFFSGQLHPTLPLSTLYGHFQQQQMQQCDEACQTTSCLTDFEETCHPVQDTSALIEDLFAVTCMMDDSLKKRDVKSLYISSSDSLRNRRIIQTIPQGWNDRPPLFPGRDQDGLLKGVSECEYPCFDK